MRWLSLLAACAALGLLLATDRAGAQGTLGAPTISSVSVTTNSLTVSWTAPADNGGSAIVAYDLRYIRSDATDKADANWTVEEVWTTGGGALQYELTDLPDGTKYDLQLRADNGADGPWTDTREATTRDHSNSRSGATVLTLGGSVRGSIDPATDSDHFRISVTGSTDLWVYTSGSDDTVGELLSSGGSLLAENDDGILLDGRLDFSIRHEVSAGTYYVKVTSHEAEETASYTIHARAAPDPGDTIDTATTVTLDSMTPGRISPGGTEDDEDYFKLELSSTTDVWVIAVGEIDTYGELFTVDELTMDETIIEERDDSGLLGNRTGFMLRDELAAGTYYIRVTGFETHDTGPYTLFVRTATEPGSSLASSRSMALGIPETGNISSATDEDYFSFTIDEQMYLFMYAIPFGDIFALTPTAFDSSNSEIDTVTIPPTGRQSFARWGDFEAGTYRIKIAAPTADDTGGYLFQILVSTYGETEERCTGLTTAQSDPWHGCAWHLDNANQFPGGRGQDINVEEVWATTMGAGINVALVDDGLQYEHEDLTGNVITARNHDYFGSDVFDPLAIHGTLVAGVLAARDNDLGVRGVAPRASTYVYNAIYGGLPEDVIAADAMGRNKSDTAVNNNSWGPPRMLGSPGPLWEAAIVDGVTNGYGGKGVFYVFAGGNDIPEGHDANLDGYANHYGVTAVCSVNHTDVRASYSERGSNLWICAPSGDGSLGLPGIPTTENGNRYTDSFSGTSASAPIVSGVAALMRAVNSNLTWRDIKLILAASARKNDSSNSGWVTGAVEYGSTTNERYHFNHEYGFGMVDAGAAVTLAQSWTSNLPALREIEAQSDIIDLALPDAPSSGSPTLVSTSLTVDPYVGFVEFVEVNVVFDHPAFRDITMFLRSPSGASSRLVLGNRQTAHFSDGTTLKLTHPLTGTFRLGSARHLGENAAGTWTLRIRDAFHEDVGTLTSWSIKVYGHGFSPGEPELTSVTPGSGALTVSWSAPGDIGGSAVSSYDLRYIRDDAPDQSDGRWTEVKNVGTSSSLEHEITGLAGEVKYSVEVRANNDTGPGPWSEPYPEGTLPVVPGAPSITSVEARDRGLAVSWSEPAYIGASEVNAYNLRYIKSAALSLPDAIWTELRNVWRPGGGDLRYVARNLENGTAYSVEVQAVNSSGAGGWSATDSGTPEELNSAPEFPGVESGERSVDENTAAGVNVGTAVAARDDESDSLTYTLSGSAASVFDIVAGTGQLRTKEPLDHEGTPGYSGTVSVSDGKNRAGEADTAIDDTISVTITVGDVDEAPEITGRDSVEVDEDASRFVETYSASDPEGAAAGLTLGGADGGDFEFDGSVLEFAATPDYESPADSNRDNVYLVTLTASDGSNTRPLAVTVTVGNVDEAGTVMLSSLQPQAGTAFTASLSDPDGRASGVTWQWETSPNGSSNWTTIDSATSSSYTPRDDDVGDYLRVTASYTDPEGGGKSAQAVSANAVQAAPVTPNSPPVFPQTETGQRSVAENTPAGRDIGALVEATDDDNDTLTYSLDSASLAFFAIDEGTGQLRTKAALDRERRSSYSVRVTARDPSRASSNLTVTITILDEDEDPVLSGQPVVSYAEGGTGVVATYSAADPERAAITWSLSGIDDDDFAISDRGALTFLAAPDYDAPTDAGGDNVYEVTVTAADPAANSDSIGVTVNVTEVTGPPIIIGPFIAIPGGGGPPPGPQPSDEDFEWNVERDIEALDESNDRSSGIWSDGTTLLVLDNAEGAGDAIYAYDLESGERLEEREFALHETNRAPRGAWSDGETVWVSDSGQDRLFAYDLESGERLEEREIVLASRNKDARGIWSDGTTVWVLDGGKDSVFAYDLQSGGFIAEYALADANGDPRGLWSDGVTLWVADHGAKQLFAYRLPVLPGEPPEEPLALERVSEEDFAEPGRVGNNSPRGIWSDGAVIYVADENDDRVYSYNVPDATDARLEALEISGVDFGEFSPLRHDYASETIPHGNIVTVTATPAQDGASVQIEPPDHDGDPENGHHLRLLPGLEITVTVTSPDGSRMRVYRVALGEEEETGPGPDCLRGAVGVGFSLVVYEGGSVEELEACAEARHVTALYVLSGGEYVPYILGAPDFANARFGALFADGIAALLPLVVRSEGPATPAAAAPPAAEPWPSCLQGEIAEGFSLVVYEGGSVADLEACARDLGVTAVYALVEGEYVPYIIGAPEFATARFRSLFADGVSAATPLTVRGAGP